ncbi:efflux RND transporter periplasmic adaptor subunit [Leptospira haakeii]|uniref:Efflux transporter periplasmic adaptor subunit n=1 Tax=Leptospira haakeii TaxID=2023198 RepID=A0ABX4PM29_9LEPT|nr:efflux RND transporter periplasmic adaptor subunit [Leptospira haakeii]PKA16844.1 efflux transporter periplasmic adaptor subunit [Leptospira haakeii]PKA19265.1 efflux transporter periplasmic adaptor subunit [Leptospira haakeii]
MKRSIFIIIILVSLIGGSIWVYKKFFKSKSNRTVLETVSSTEFEPIQVEKEQRDLFQLETIRIEKKNFRRTIPLIGEVAAVPDQVVEVPSRVSGRLVSIKFVEGSKVEKGQLLAVLDSPELARLRSSYHSSKTKHSAALLNLERIRNLVSMKLAAKQEEIDAEAVLKVNAADLKAAEENLRANGLEPNEETSGKYYIYSPMSGIVLNRNALPGSIVTGTQNLATVGNISRLWFMAKIFEGDLSKISEGSKADVILNSYPDLVFAGVLEHIGEQVDLDSRTIHARFSFSNIGRKAKIGLFGTVKVVTNTGLGILVPQESVFKIQNDDFVFVKLSADSFVPKKVILGSSEETNIEVKEGLSEGEDIVTKGVFELKSLFLKSSFGEEE